MIVLRCLEGEDRMARLKRLIGEGLTRRDLTKLHYKAAELDAMKVPRLRTGPTGQPPQSKLPAPVFRGPKMESEMWMEPCGWVTILGPSFEIGNDQWHVNVRNKHGQELTVPVGDLQ